MIKWFLSLFLVFSSLTAGQYGFLRNPAISPDGNTIVFSYSSDLWQVSSTGGTAFRITGMDGNEDYPSFSPDGEFISFSSNQDGNYNVYLVPAAGGEIRQLTWNDANDYVETWDWSSENIYFSSGRENMISTYMVPAEGGTPKRLFSPGHFFNLPHNISINPADGACLFNESWESFRFDNRKRYKGPFNPDIKSYDLETGEYRQLTNWEGKDMWPEFDKNGNLFFVSDRYNEEFNLYRLKDGKEERLTGFQTSLRRPSVSAEGNKIVFEKDYRIFIYDTGSGKSEAVSINLFDNKVLPLETKFETSGEITYFDISPDGEKIAFISRGRLFVSDKEGKFVKELDSSSDERVTEALWLSDNKTILFTRTVKGWLNLFTIRADKKGTEKQLTDNEFNSQEITLNEKRTKALYYSGRNFLNMMNLESFNETVIAEDEFWAIYNHPAYFSPDEKYILYPVYRNFELDIMVYDIEEGKSLPITRTGVTEGDPFWSPDGKYIYFSTNRTKAVYPFGRQDFDIYRIKLENFGKPFKNQKYEELFSEEKKDTTKPVVKIDFENLRDRWRKIISYSGNQLSPRVFIKDEKTTIYFTSSHDGAGRALWKKTITPFEDSKTEKIEGTSGLNLPVRESKGDHYILVNGNISKIKSGGKTEKINISHSFIKNLRDEFNQMFYEMWANMEENFYDENFHGVDWENTRERYSAYLPYVRTRGDLRKLMNDMLGELNSSHQGFSSSGDEEKTGHNFVTASTGIIFGRENPLLVEKIIRRSPADKIDLNIKKGDKLLAVNGVPVEEDKNREKYFLFPSFPEEINLTFERSGSEFSVNIHPQRTRSERNLLYDKWTDLNQKIVDDKGKGKIAYIHMKNMMGDELDRFLTEIANEFHYREALILDLRYNRGGNVHDKVLEMLIKKPYMNWKYRGGKLTAQPNFYPGGKPMVLLINEQSLSDAELTTAGWKELGLGKVIGNGTYRWLIFTSGKSLVDGSFYRLPSWGCYTLDGKNIEINGAEPDIKVINTFEDRLNNNDPQLLKAIEELNKMLK